MTPSEFTDTLRKQRKRALKENRQTAGALRQAKERPVTGISNPKLSMREPPTEMTPPADSSILALIRSRRVFFDGGTGTLLQSMGLEPGEAPETWNLTHPEQVKALHRAYLEAGCDIIKTNTFGVNPAKYPNYRELISAGIALAREAAEEAEAAGFGKKYVAFDMGPTGKLLEPLGDLPFETAVSLFASNVRAAVESTDRQNTSDLPILPVDLILIETMNDAYETKAAVLAAKETCSLPVMVTNVYDESGKLMTGASPEAMIALLEGLGVDALGMNCSLGPDKMLDLIDIFAKKSSLPIVVNPNAGLPELKDGKTVYTMDKDRFAAACAKLCQRGATLLGGCCGTTPAYLSAVREAVRAIPYALPTPKEDTFVSSYTHAVSIGKEPILIGERINPTGKKKLKEALRAGDMNYLLTEAIRQAEKGVQILDVNVGLPEIDEAETMAKAVCAVQSVTDLPLQIDTADPATLSRAMRLYNGKPLVNSVNGKEESIRAVFPLVKRYGGAVIALTIGEDGIPATPEARVALAERIIQRAWDYGIPKKEIIVDPLAMAVSSDPQSADITLETVRRLHERGIRTSLGVSNISFGLPERDIINTVFFANALSAGLDCAIMNPFSPRMMGVYQAHRALHGLDEGFSAYLAFAGSPENQLSPATSAGGISSGENNHGGTPPGSAQGGSGSERVFDVSAPSSFSLGLGGAIYRGMKEEARKATETLLLTEEPLALINGHIIPALNEIGAAFEAKKAYLPQLLMSAEAASASFELVKRAMAKSPAVNDGKKREFILATVRGDIHDIGKNIVRVMLESYGFTVHDLGRDVPPERVVRCVEETGCRLVGLSALMTTTVPAMEETIRQLKQAFPDVKVAVGGAVLTKETAERIGADFYSPDAMATVRFAETWSIPS